MLVGRAGLDSRRLGEAATRGSRGAEQSRGAEPLLTRLGRDHTEREREKAMARGRRLRQLKPQFQTDHMCSSSMAVQEKSENLLHF